MTQSPTSPKRKSGSTVLRTGIAIVTVVVAGLVKSLTGQDAEPAITTTADTAAEHQLEHIPAYETGKLIGRNGKEVIVTGKVASTHISSSSGHHFLNFSSAKLRVICEKGDIAAFPAGGPAALYKEKTVEIQGTIDLYKGAPQIRITSPDQVRLAGASKPAVEKTSNTKFELKKTGPDTWESPAGLRYAGRDPQGKTRVEHVLRHAKDDPRRSGSHGVFTGGDSAVFPLLDEAWLLSKKHAIRPVSQGDSNAYTIPMGRKIGYLGGSSGVSQRNPPLTKVFIVVKRGTSNVVTAYPRK